MLAAVEVKLKKKRFFLPVLNYFYETYTTVAYSPSPSSMLFIWAMKRDAEVIKRAVPSIFTVAPIGRTNLSGKRRNNVIFSLRYSRVHTIACHASQGYRKRSSSEKKHLLISQKTF